MYHPPRGVTAESSFLPQANRATELLRHPWALPPVVYDTQVYIVEESESALQSANPALFWE